MYYIVILLNGVVCRINKAVDRRNSGHTGSFSAGVLLASVTITTQRFQFGSLWWFFRLFSAVCESGENLLSCFGAHSLET